MRCAFLICLLTLWSTLGQSTPDQMDDGTPAKPPSVNLADIQKQINATFSRVMADMVSTFQRLNVTALAKQLAQTRPSEPKLTFEGVSRLEIPLGNGLEMFKQMAEKLPGLNLLRP